MLEIDNNMLEIDNPEPYVIHRDSKGKFIKGYSANPGGNPPGKVISLVALLRKQLTEHPEDAKAIVDSLIKMGKTRELGAIKELLDRIDGKVVERHRLEGELPIRLVFVPAKALLEGQGEGESIPKLTEGNQGA